MALSDMFSILGLIINVVDKLFFIGLCFYFGNLSFKGWKGKRNLIFKIISIIIIGLVCFFGGLIVQDFLGWSFFASDYISSLIVAGICFLLLLLISSGFKVKEKYATKMDIVSLVKDIKELKIQVAKLTKALEDRKMMPAPLDEAGIRKELEKKYKPSEIISISQIEDAWACIVKTKKGKKEIILDAYTGSITETKDITNPFEFLYKKPLSTVGILLFIGFLFFLGSNISLSTINAFNNAFDFSFLFTEPLPNGCLSTSSLLEGFQTSEVSVSANNTILSAGQPTSYHMIPTMTKSVQIEGSTFFITTAYNIPVTSLGSEITLSDWDNIYNVRVCSFKSDYTLCECIGGSQTDPVFTVPFLIQLGLIEEALSNAILGSLTGALGGGDSPLGGLSGLIG